MITVSQIKQLTTGLFEMVEDNCYNSISSNILYIITKKSDGHEVRFGFHQKALPTEVQLLDAEEAARQLNKSYDSLYDVNFYRYKASKSHSIVEIRCFLKEFISPEVLDKMGDHEPMFHAKLPYPPYLASRQKEKFDVNWQHHPLKTYCKLLLHKFKMR